MKISFISNFMNHHQLPFCTELLSVCDGKFTFWATTPLPEEQAKLGYKNLNNLPFVTEIYNSDENYEECRKAMNDDDYVIFGTSPDELIDIRRKSGKPYAIFSERILKKSPLRRFYPPTRKKITRRFGGCEANNACVLAASAYLAYDLSLVHMYPKVYKWGYFPDVSKYENIDNIITNKKKNSILWVARFLKLKHPEFPVEIAEQLKKDGIDFTLNMIGTGEEFEKTKKLIEQKNLSDCVHLLGAMPPDKVREYMKKSEIFLFTSNKIEGWGAVINESMNSACAVVANSEIGGVPFLIEDKANGLIYHNGNLDELYEKVKFLIGNSSERVAISKNAYTAMTDLWNAKIAANRLYHIIDAIVNNKQVPVYKSGPCSISDIISDKWR